MESVLVAILIWSLLLYLIWKTIIQPFFKQDPESEQKSLEEEKKRRHAIGMELYQEYQREQLKDAWRK